MRYWSLIFLGLVGFNLWVWQGVLALQNKEYTQVYFLDIGQGDSQLIVLPSGVKLLIDGGQNKEVLFELAKVIPDTDRYIDMVFMSHPQLDHYGGLKEVIDRYNIGAFVFSGILGSGEAWKEFEDKLVEKGISVVNLREGDRILNEENQLDVLWPRSSSLQSSDPNEDSLVLKLESQGVKFLFTGDIGVNTEEKLVELYDLDIDVLKVAHHGSRYSTSRIFLEEATPALSVIQVGENRFGHPTPTVIQKLYEFGSSVYRNDEDGRVLVVAKDGILAVQVE